MKREKRELLNINGEDVIFIRKDIKNIYIAVEKPCGRVKVSTPWRASIGTVKEILKRKHNWIEVTKDRIKKSSSIAGNSDIFCNCFLFGEKNAVKIIQGKKASIEKDGEIIKVTLKNTNCREQLQDVVNFWHREKLSEYIENNKDKWEGVVGQKANEWRIKKMKTRWGSCNTRDRRVWLSLSLAKEKVAFVDYIMVHELVHFIEKGHNKRFYSLMDKFYPQWRSFKKRRN